MDTAKIQENLAKASDLEQYLDHIAWKGIVLPWLEKEKAQFQSYLVEVVLSHKPLEMQNGQLLTAERCAAYVEAINGLTRLFDIINRRRDSALAQLQDVDIFQLEDIDEDHG